MKVLVSGGSGFIGSNLVKELSEHESITEIIVLDIELFGRRKLQSSPKVTYVVDSILNETILDTLLLNCDYVFHLAALISVPGSFEYIEEYNRVNVLGTITLLEACKKHNIKHFVFSSSCAASCPISPYAINKLACEKYVDLYNKYFKTTSLRYYNVYGINQDPDKAYAAAVPKFIKQAKSGNVIIIYGTGEQTRDFVHVTDVARVNIHCVINGVTGLHDIGYGESVSIVTLANTIKELLNSTSDIKFDSPRLGDVMTMSCDNLSIIKNGFKFAFNIENGLRYILQFV
jgi:UDP-glucose 4-epimerase